jgi:hypothetical protein
MAKPVASVQSEVIASVVEAEVQTTPTFEQSIAAINQQIDANRNYSMVCAALLTARDSLVKFRVKELQDELKVVRKMLPARKTRKPKVAA